jgi:hypothetical protein
MLLLTILAWVICWGGQYSSKNVQKEHKKLLSFYALLGPIDGLALWLQLLMSVLMAEGAYWIVAIPAIALIVNYSINFGIYKPLWDEIDPPKPLYDDRLTQAEIRSMNKCDRWFDKWVTKYPGVAGWIRCLVLYLSHKIFFLPYTHFFGYMHFTLRSQDFMVVWQWDPKEVMELGFNLNKFKKKDANGEHTHRYRGMLVYRRAIKSSEKMKMLQDDMLYDKWSDESDNQLDIKEVIIEKPNKSDN